MGNTFKKGDVVQLKSGGHAMTVEKTKGNTVSVIWGNEKTYILKERDFDCSMLTLATDIMTKNEVPTIVGMVIK